MRSENVLRTVAASAFLLDMTVRSSSGVMVSPSDVPVGQLQPLTTVVSCTDAGSMVTPFVVPPPPDIEQPCKQLQDFLTCRAPESRQPSLLCSLSASSSARTLQQKLPEFSWPSFSIDRFQPLRGNSSPPTGKALLPRRRITACFRIWMIQTLPSAVGRFRGQNTLLLCLHVRRSGLCCQLDPPVLPTGSVVRISTTLPEGSLTSASVIASSDHSVLTTLLSEGSGETEPVLRVTHRYSESGDLLCSDGNPASGLLPLLIQPFVNAGCRESFRLHSQRAAHVWTWVTVPVHYNLMITPL